ncbi:hypothetical protein Tco_0414476 [Tanacetum coccineum]
MGPAPSTVKKKPEKSNKQMGSTPLRRSERGKNRVDVHASNIKSTEKSGDISKEIAEEGSRDSNGGSKKRKRYDAVEFKARKSPSFQKQMGPTTRNRVDVPASNVKSIEKSVVTEEGSRDSNGGTKKWKRYDAGEFKSRKSPRFQKQMGPTTRSAIKKKPEKSEKIGSTPLRRSERGKNPVDVPALNVKACYKPQQVRVETEALQSSGQILAEDIARKERNEIDKFDSELDEKKKTIVNDFSLEKTFIRNCTTRPRSCDLMESGKEDQESREVAPALFGNLIEEESHHKPMHDMCPVVVLDGVVNLSNSNNDMVSDSHTSEKHMANATGLDTTVFSEQLEISSKADADATHDADIDMAPNDYSADMSHAVEDPNKNGSNDISLHADSDQMGIPAANDLTPHIEYADGSHAVEDPNGTRPNHVAPNVRSVELGIPAGNCNQEKAEDTTPSIQQVASPVSDHSMPAIPEIHNDSHLLQQPTEDRIQDQEGQADHTPMIQKINIDCEKEIAEAIAEIRLKYHNKRQEADATFNSRKKEVESNMYIVSPGHICPFASSGIRSSTSPMRSSNPASSSRPPGFGTYHRKLPVQHVTMATNTIRSLPWPLLPHSCPSSSLLRGPSVPQIGGPQDKLNDNVKTLTCNAARALNILKTPEFPGGGNGAQPPSAHELGSEVQAEAHGLSCVIQERIPNNTTLPDAPRIVIPTPRATRAKSSYRKRPARRSYRADSGFGASKIFCACWSGRAPRFKRRLIYLATLFKKGYRTTPLHSMLLELLYRTVPQKNNSRLLFRAISTESSHRNWPIRRSSRADSSLRQLSNDGSEQEDQVSESRTLDDDDLYMNDRGEQKNEDQLLNVLPLRSVGVAKGGNVGGQAMPPPQEIHTGFDPRGSGSDDLGNEIIPLSYILLL